MLLTLIDALSLYADYAPDITPETQSRMGYEVSRWNRVMHSPSLPEICLDSFVSFRSRGLRAGLSPRSVEDSLSTVRLLMVTAKTLGKSTAEAPPIGRRLRIEKPKPRPATCDELVRLWTSADAMTWPVTETWQRPAEWWRAWLAVGFWTGLRLSDLTWRLTLEHWGATSILFRARKTGVEHVYPTHSRLAWIAERAKGLTQPILNCAHTPTRLREHLTKLCTLAGVRRITPKNLRQAAVQEWSKADSRAGELIHGCGMPAVLLHYLDPLDILLSAAPRVAWPFPDVASSRQLTLF